MISDPKALQYIYHTGGYYFAKQKERREVSRMLSGRGLLWSDGSFISSFSSFALTPWNRFYSQASKKDHESGVWLRRAQGTCPDFQRFCGNGTSFPLVEQHIFMARIAHQ